jgi:cold shock CspA family protein
MRGELLWFNRVKGYGRIRTEDGEQLLVDRAGFQAGHVPTGPCKGTPVTFDLVAASGEDEGSAVHVAVIVEPPQRRARRHGSSIARW